MRRKILYGMILTFLAGLIIACSSVLFIGDAMDRKNASLYEGFETETKAHQGLDVPGISVDWDSLLKTNNEVVGWVYVDADEAEKTISYPVLYREGDREFYLRHNINGEYSKYGVPYIPGDYDLTGNVISIHGHNFGNDAHTMFSPLLMYENQEYVQRHPVFWFAKQGEDFEPYRIFSVVEYDCTDLINGAPCWNYLQTDFDSRIEYQEWLNQAKKNSMFQLSGSPNMNDEVVILSTCQTATATNIRCVVFGYQERG